MSSRAGFRERVAAHVSNIIALRQRSPELAAATVHSFTRSNPAPALSPQEERATVLRTIEADSFTAGLLLQRMGFDRPAVLNMANKYNCGGAWCDHAGSQEEDLFRRSTLPVALWPRRRTDDARLDTFDEQLPRELPIYPFAEATCVYSPHVLVTRSEGGQQLPAPSPPFGILTSAAQDLRDYKAHYEGPFNEELTTQLMRSMLWTAAEHGHTTVVLGAYGCGAFRHDPAVVSSLFHNLLEGEFKGRFAVVLFAIIKSRYNLDTFGGRFPLLTAGEEPALRDVAARVRGERS